MNDLSDISPASPIADAGTTAQAALELLPIPAAVIARTAVDVRVAGGNAAFHAAGLVPTGAGSGFDTPLGTEISAFLDGHLRQTRLAWQVGTLIDAHHYQLCLGRLPERDGARCLLTAIDRTPEMRAKLSLQREMATDSLTGLPNRASFTELLEATVTAGTRHALLMVDLARFSRVNECLGSMAGDELLISVARRIKGALRASDTLARTGSDEFGVLVVLEASDEATHVAERIRRVLASPFRLTDYEIKVDCAVGMAAGSTGQFDAETVIRHAQFAVKRAKETGRIERYQRRALDRARAAFGVETELRRAIENQRLRLSFQPICDLVTGRVDSFEALARWTDDAGVERSPCEFIPVAEESGLIVPLGRWVIGEALRTLARWDVAVGGACGTGMAINLSAIQLQRDGVAAVVAEALGATGIDGTRIKLELTESALIVDPDGISDTLHALKALGATLAMDDFGTGYSNLANLRRLPIDLLKIDRSFVTEMLVDRDKLAIVRAILSLAQALGMKTVAEGIETDELARTLGALGCTMGQGFLYARPLGADEAFALLSARNS